MWTTFGVFLLILGFVLIIGGLARALFVRSGTPSSWKYAAMLTIIGTALILLSFFMLHKGEGRGVERVPIGIAVILAGLILMAIGTWLALLAPIAIRKTTEGWKLVLMGLAVLVIGILILTVAGGPHFTGLRGTQRSPVGMPDWNDISSRRVGSIPYGAFALAAMLAVNGLGLRRGLSGKALLGANIFIIAALVWLYWLLGN